MSTHTEHAAHAGAHSHDDPKIYVRTLIALLCLTALTVGAAYVDFGSGNVVIALTIATIKASLVALFFMHLAYDKAVNAIIAMTGFLFLGIFLMFCLIDFDSREPLRPVNWDGKMPIDTVTNAPGTTGAPVATPTPAPGK